MKKKLCILIAMLLMAVCLPCLALSEVTDAIVLEQEPKLEHTFYAGTTRYIELAELEIENFYELYRKYDCEPEWSFNVTNANEDMFYFYEGWQYCSLELWGGYTLAPGDIVIDVTCTWADLTLKRTFTLHVKEVPAEVLEGIPTQEIPTQHITLAYGETLSLSPADLLPVLAQLGDSYSFRGYAYALETGELEVIIDTETGDMLLELQDPGVYMVEYTCYPANLAYPGVLYVHVEGPDGQVPEPMPVLEWDVTEAVFYLGNGQSGSVNTRQISFQAGFSNAERLMDYYNVEEAEWHLSDISGEAGLFRMGWYMGEENRGAHAYLELEPTHEGDIQICLSTDWLGREFSQIFTLHVVMPPMGAPLGLDFPEEIVLQKGETVQFNVSELVRPYGWMLEGHEPEFYFYCSGEGIYDDQDGDIITITGDDYGAGTGSWRWECANYRFEGTFIIKVVDENGQIPHMEPLLDIGLCRPYIGLQELTAKEREGWPPHAFEAYVENYSALSILADEAPLWTVTPVSGDADFLGYQMASSSLYAYIADHPKQTGDVELLITYTIGEYSASSTVIIPVREGAYMPYALDFPEKITLKVGESYSFSPLSVLPAGWQEPAGWEVPELNSRGGWEPSPELGIYSDNDELYKKRYQGGNVVITAVQAGQTILELDWYYDLAGEFDVYKNVLLEVVNEDDSLPIPEWQPIVEMYFEDDWKLYAGCGQTELGWYSIPVDQLLHYQELTGQKPVWSVEMLQGELDLSFQPYAERYGHVMLNQPVMQPGSYAFRLTCTCGEYTWSQEYTINVAVHPFGIPEKLNLPDRLVVERGRTFLLPLDLTPDSFDGYGEFYIEDASDEFYDAFESEETNNGSEMIIHKCGEYPVRIEWYYDGIEVSKNMVIEVIEKPKASLAYTDAVLDVGVAAKPFRVNGDNISSVVWTSESSIISSDGVVCCAEAGHYAVQAEVAFRTGRTARLSATVTAEEMKDLLLPQSLKKLEQEALRGTAAEHVLIPAGTTAIGSQAFADCAALRLVTVPFDVEQIASDAFAGAEEAVILCLADSPAEQFAKDVGMRWYYLVP